MAEWNQKFSRAEVEKDIMKKEGRNHQYIDHSIIDHLNQVKHPSRLAFVSLYLSKNKKKTT